MQEDPVCLIPPLNIPSSNHVIWMTIFRKHAVKRWDINHQVMLLPGEMDGASPGLEVEGVSLSTPVPLSHKANKTLGYSAAPVTPSTLRDTECPDGNKGWRSRLEKHSSQH